MSKIINEFNIKEIIEELSKKNKLFCSEKHLQTMFAFETLEKYRNCQCIPEYPLRDPKTNKTKHIDLFLKINSRKIGIEFKYIVCKYEEKINDIDYFLRNHSALDLRRYDCFKDIERLEQLKKNKVINGGYFLLLTNDETLWNNSERNTCDKDFRFKDKGKITKGYKNWNNNPSEGTIKGRNNSIYISNEYKTNFKEYSRLNKNNGKHIFKYLLIKVE